MGSDKGLLPYKNSTLIEHAIDSIKPYCVSIILSTNNTAYGRFEYKVVKDHYKGIGPLGGIFSGLSESDNNSCLITACDIPFIDKEILKDMIAEADHAQFVLLKIPDGFFQPFPVILSCKVLPLIAEQIRLGNHKLQNVYTIIEQQMQNDVCIIDIETAPENINRKEDLVK